VRRSIAVLSLAVLAAFGLAGVAPSPARAGTPLSPAKVVIIVGATEGTTATYRSRADAAYAEAIKYTPNVVKVYSPNATWARVKSATVGASIVIYFGHGNGWPSPYTYDPTYATKDGFGLNNDNNGDGKLSDYEKKYYGEPAVRTLDLAPNAIVLLHNLCYASGNSEPGYAEPTVSVARQRISNYAAGFLQSNAQAVLADGHHGPADYLRALFTTDQTIESMWRNAPDRNGHVSGFTSTRTAGVRALMDPEGTTSGYYRSLVTDPMLTTTMVTNRADTSRDPATLVVPGRAQVRMADAALYPDAAIAAAGSMEGVTPLPAGTRLATVARSTQLAADGASLVEVQGLDDPALHGVMRAVDLIPMDSAAPKVLAVDPISPLISPNGDGTADTVTVSGSLSETSSWTVSILAPDDTVLASASGSGTTPRITWDGLLDGQAVADGSYRTTIRATDPWQNIGSRSGSIRVDTTPPSLTGVIPGEDAAAWFSPNGDGVRETVSASGTLTEAASVVVRIQNADAITVRSFAVAAGTTAGGAVVSWDGKDGSGHLVPDGTYQLRMTPRDLAGNVGPGVTRAVTVVRLLGFVTTSRTLFYPQDRDDLARATALRFTLARPGTVSWTIRNAAGTIVATLLADAPVAAGVTGRNFYGLTETGAMLPAGRYVSYVTATDGAVTASQAVAFEMNAFRIRASATSATRGRSITITAVSAEALSTMPRVYVTQPGHAQWSVSMVKIGTLTYRATLTLKTGGSSGSAAFKVQAVDSGGRAQRTTLTLPLR
jgi:hypothetical protein